MASAHLPKTMSLTQERLMQVLSYAPLTGVFSRVRPGKKNVGNINGEGYWTIKIDGVQHQMHRLAFLYMTGKFPDNDVDHRNRCRIDNRWANLREATNAENHQNRNRQANNSSGFSGVSWDGKSKKWRARIKLRGRRYNLGVFLNVADAAAAYIAAKARLHPFHSVI